MQHTARETRSTWMESASEITRTPLPSDAVTDVCIVGAGIAGLSTAYLLAKDGAKVMVLDDGPAGGGETQRTSAHLSYVLERRYGELEKSEGETAARLVVESHAAAIGMIERIVKDEAISCGFLRVNGYLFSDKKDREKLRQELEVLHRLGKTQVELLGAVPGETYDFGPCLLFPKQAQFHPLRYLEGLARAVEKHGGIIHTGTHVSEVKGGEHAYVKTSAGHRVEAKTIVVATNAPINDGPPVFTRQAAYRTYVIAARVPKSSLHRALYWDTSDPYHYVRTFDAGKHDLLLIGGEDHKTGQANDAPLRYQRLEAWGRARFEDMGEVEQRWSGQVMESADGLAMIGHNPLDAANVFIATGDSGNGLTHGTIAGMLLCDLIRERENPWKQTYAPSRFPHELAEFTKENANVARQYLDVVTGGKKDAESLRIPLDSGTVVRRGLQQVAVYRDAEGNVSEMSAVCPHKGCIVRWNSGEKSWDCPCHGSRFACDGTVLNGPSISGLKPLEQ